MVLTVLTGCGRCLDLNQRGTLMANAPMHFHISGSNDKENHIEQFIFLKLSTTAYSDRCIQKS